MPYQLSQRSAFAEMFLRKDIANAVKEENRDNLQVSFNNTASYPSPVRSDTVTADLSIGRAKTMLQKTTYKQMCQQSEKLPGKIKRSFKTTLRRKTYAAEKQICTG
jgi:hypothetical protein